jgi:diacylglycerol kinase family enzyme
VAVANSGLYGGGMKIAPDAELDDGLFDVVTIADMPRGKFLALFPRVFKGTHVGVPEVTVRRARAVRITTNRPFVLYGDGDPIGQTPVTVRTVPHALRVIVPAG